VNITDERQGDEKKETIDEYNWTGEDCEVSLYTQAISEYNRFTYEHGPLGYLKPPAALSRAS
jgi:hypothetical protein